MKKIELDKISLDDLWEEGDVANIPHGARRVVYYDLRDGILSSWKMDFKRKENFFL